MVSAPRDYNFNRLHYDIQIDLVFIPKHQRIDLKPGLHIGPWWDRPPSVILKDGCHDRIDAVHVHQPCLPADLKSISPR